jgi:hypothetical protein
VKRIILTGALALLALAACGETNSAGTGNTSAKSAPAATTVNADGTTAPAATTATTSKPTDDTVTINDVSEMPPQCIKLFGAFLKKIEPEVSKIDWKKATGTEVQALGDAFSKESDDLDAQMTAAGCDKYNLAGSDKQVFNQLAKIAAAEAPGTLGFLEFISTLNGTSTTGASVPADCAGTIAALEPILAKGGKLQDLPFAEAAKISPLFSAVGTKCSADEASAFFARADVKSFVGG